VQPQCLLELLVVAGAVLPRNSSSVITERLVRAWVGPLTMTSGSGHSTVDSSPSRGSIGPMKNAQSRRPSRTEDRFDCVFRECSEI
jgi:hypothetical protein